MTEKQIKNLVLKLNRIIARKKAEMFGWEYTPRMLVKTDKDLRKLRLIILHLIKTGTLEFIEEYVDFVIRYYNKSQYTVFPPISYFAGNKVKLEWQAQGMDFIRFSFKPTTNGFTGPIWNKREATYYGFPEEELLDEIERSFAYMRVMSEAMKYFEAGEEFTVDKRVLSLIELVLASMIRQRGIYTMEIPKFYKLWRSVK